MSSTQTCKGCAVDRPGDDFVDESKKTYLACQKCRHKAARVRLRNKEKKQQQAEGQQFVGW